MEKANLNFEFDGVKLEVAAEVRQKLAPTSGGYWIVSKNDGPFFLEVKISGRFVEIVVGEENLITTKGSFSLLIPPDTEKIKFSWWHRDGGEGRAPSIEFLWV